MKQASESRNSGVCFFNSMNNVVTNLDSDFPKFVQKFANLLMFFCVLYNTLGHTPAPPALRRTQYGASVAGGARELRFL
jgi:hypothetical protein